MSLPVREQQVLDRIETVLQDSEATLTAMFGLFTRLAGDEEKPGVEELGLASLRSRLPPRGRSLALQAQEGGQAAGIRAARASGSAWSYCSPC